MTLWHSSPTSLLQQCAVHVLRLASMCPEQVHQYCRFLFSVNFQPGINLFTSISAMFQVLCFCLDGFHRERRVDSSHWILPLPNILSQVINTDSVQFNYPSSEYPKLSNSFWIGTNGGRVQLAQLDYSYSEYSELNKSISLPQFPAKIQLSDLLWLSFSYSGFCCFYIHIRTPLFQFSSVV